MTVREMKERLDAMVNDLPWLLDADVCVWNDEFQSWGNTDVQEDLNVVRCKSGGGKFLGIGMRPRDYEDWEVIWPEDKDERGTD